MSNEILLVLSIFIIYGSVIVMYKLFGKQGLFCFTSIATIAANIEVLIMVKAFGMVMTLGNVLFASTFLITDIVSEVYGKKDAKRASTYWNYNINCIYNIFTVVAFIHTGQHRFCNACNADNFFKYTKTYDYKYGCIRYSSGI